MPAQKAEEAPERASRAGDDPLAIGLPGLPTKVDGVSISESGFCYRPADTDLKPLSLDWRDVSAVRRHAGDIHVETTNAEGKAVYVLREDADRPESKLMLEAWTEYVTRRIEAEGRLRGVLVSSTAESNTPPISRPMEPKFLDKIWPLALVALGSLTLTVLEDFGMALDTLLSMRYVAVGVMVVAFLLDLIGSERCEPVQYELTGADLSVTAGEGLRVLRPGQGDTISPRKAVIDGVKLPLQQFSGYPVVMQLLLALGSRSGATILPESSRYRKTFLVGLAGLVVVFLMSPILPRWGGTVISILIIGTTILFTELARAKAIAQLGRDLDTGQRILERLGW